ncbi:hypothetical protein B0H12DRAFT_1142955 [Mycena haematopus]|nr:hypothetical protein B0H12DRAFT_1142955 [Mycena haematopus]
MQNNLSDTSNGYTMEGFSSKTGHNVSANWRCMCGETNEPVFLIAIALGVQKSIKWARSSIYANLPNNSTPTFSMTMSPTDSTPADIITPTQTDQSSAASTSEPQLLPTSKTQMQKCCDLLRMLMAEMLSPWPYSPDNPDLDRVNVAEAQTNSNSSIIRNEESRGLQLLTCIRSVNDFIVDTLGHAITSESNTEQGPLDTAWIHEEIKQANQDGLVVSKVNADEYCDLFRLLITAGMARPVAELAMRTYLQDLRELYGERMGVLVSIVSAKSKSGIYLSCETDTGETYSSQQETLKTEGSRFCGPKRSRGNGDDGGTSFLRLCDTDRISTNGPTPSVRAGTNSKSQNRSPESLCIMQSRFLRSFLC